MKTCSKSWNTRSPRRLGREPLALAIEPESRACPAKVLRLTAYQVTVSVHDPSARPDKQVYPTIEIAPTTRAYKKKKKRASKKTLQSIQDRTPTAHRTNPSIFVRPGPSSFSDQPNEPHLRHRSPQRHREIKCCFTFWLTLASTRHCLCLCLCPLCACLIWCLTGLLGVVDFALPSVGCFRVTGFGVV